MVASRTTSSSDSGRVRSGIGASWARAAPTPKSKAIAAASADGEAARPMPGPGCSPTGGAPSGARSSSGASNPPPRLGNRSDPAEGRPRDGRHCIAARPQAHLLSQRPTGTGRGSHTARVRQRLRTPRVSGSRGRTAAVKRQFPVADRMPVDHAMRTRGKEEEMEPRASRSRPPSAATPRLWGRARSVRTLGNRRPAGIIIGSIVLLTTAALRGDGTRGAGRVRRRRGRARRGIHIRRRRENGAGTQGAGHPSGRTRRLTPGRA